jgi:hypothetical protein
MLLTKTLQGFFSSRGRLLYMADADGASKLCEFFQQLERGYLALPTAREGKGDAVRLRVYVCMRVECTGIIDAVVCRYCHRLARTSCRSTKCQRGQCHAYKSRLLTHILSYTSVHYCGDFWRLDSTCWW